MEHTNEYGRLISLHKTKSNDRQKPEEFVDIKRIAKVWVTQPNVLELDRTNGRVAETT